MRWDVQEEEDKAKIVAPQLIRELIESQALDAHFQPIFSAHTGRVYGYEALARVAPNFVSGSTPTNIADLFESARRSSLLPALDIACRENSFRRAAELGVGQRDCYLFVNVCPETLMNPAHQVGLTERLAEESNLSKDKIIFEITEETAVKDYDLFCRALTQLTSTTSSRLMTTTASSAATSSLKP